MKIFQQTLVTILLLVSSNLTAQKINFGVDMGYAGYQMSENKALIDGIMASNPLHPQRVENYPNYLFYRPYVSFARKMMTWGVDYTLMSTASRYSIHDYSGDYKFDTKIVGNSAGIFLELPVNPDDKLKIFIASELGYVFSRLELHERLELYNIAENNVSNYQEFLVSNSFFVKPYLKAEVPILWKISSFFSIGYYVNLGKIPMKIENKLSANQTPFVANWNGFRLSAGLQLSLDE